MCRKAKNRNGGGENGIFGFFTDELIGVVEILAEILLAGIGCRQLFEDDSAGDDVLVAGEIGRHVEDP